MDAVVSTNSSNATLEPRDTKINPKGEFLNELSNRIVIDKTRENFASETFETLELLVNGTKINSNGYCRLLLGRKGIGKTCLLKHIQEVYKSLKSNCLNLTCVYEKYSTFPFKSPSCLISDALEITSFGTINQLEKKLQEQNKFVFLIIDELQHVFLSDSCLDSKNIINQLFEIGDSLNGRIYCIITGSSSVLRKLCFGKLGQDEKDKYPNYSGIDLNSTKFSARWIFPFIDPQDFKKLEEYFEKKYFKKIDEDENENGKAYLKTGGNPRLFEDFINNKYTDSYSISLKDAYGNEEKILEYLYNLSKLKNTQTFFEKLKDYQPIEFSEWIRLFPIQQVNKLATDETVKLNISDLYELADKGFIRFIDNPEDINGDQTIGFASPLIFLQFAMRKFNYVLSINEIIAWKSPQGKYEKDAELLALRFLAISNNWWKSLGYNNEVPQKPIGKLDIGRPVEISTILDRLFKEECDSKDYLGADGIVIQSNGTERYIIHRFQIKLGKRFIDENEASTIKNKFSSRLKEFKTKIATNLNINEPEINHYLVTTRHLDPNSKRKLEEDVQFPVKVFDRQFLEDNVLPSILKDL